MMGCGKSTRWGTTSRGSTNNKEKGELAGRWEGGLLEDLRYGE